MSPRCGACCAASLQLLLEVQRHLDEKGQIVEFSNVEVSKCRAGVSSVMTLGAIWVNPHTIGNAEAWGPCTKLDCSSSVGEESRTVYCGGSDGGSYDGTLVTMALVCAVNSQCENLFLKAPCFCQPVCHATFLCLR